MKKTHNHEKPISAEAIPNLANKGEDVSRFFKSRRRLVQPATQPIQRVNVDLTASLIEELDQAARELNISRQAAIKTLVRQALDRHYLAQHAKKS